MKAFYWSLSLLAAAGLWRALRRRLALGSILLCLWIAYPFIYYFMQADARYHYPIDWTLALLAFYLIFGDPERQLVDKKSVRFRRIWIDIWAGDSTVGCVIVNGGSLRDAVKAGND